MQKKHVIKKLEEKLNENIKTNVSSEKTVETLDPYRNLLEIHPNLKEKFSALMNSVENNSLEEDNSNKINKDTSIDCKSYTKPLIETINIESDNDSKCDTLTDYEKRRLERLECQIPDEDINSLVNKIKKHIDDQEKLKSPIEELKINRQKIVDKVTNDDLEKRLDKVNSGDELHDNMLSRMVTSSKDDIKESCLKSKKIFSKEYLDDVKEKKSDKHIEPVNESWIKDMPSDIEELEKFMGPPHGNTTEAIDEAKKTCTTELLDDIRQKSKELYYKIKEYKKDNDKDIFFKKINNDDIINVVTNKIIEGETSYEMVNHPKHYNNYEIEVIDMMERIWGPEETAIFCKLNAFKYRMRLGTKPTSDIQEDLKKEKWYLEKYTELINKLN